MATPIVLDTHNLITKLKSRGFSEEQATGITEAIQELDLSQLATKGDVRKIEAELREMELRMINTFTSRMIAVVGVGVAILALLKFI